MKLVQKLPIGLCLACLTMIGSSCSKEDVQTPEPKVEAVNTSSTLKAESIAWMFGTKGYVGDQSYPNFWERLHDNYFNSDLAKYPGGTSNSSGLWGNSAYPWLKPFPAIPEQPGWNTFVTATTAATDKLDAGIQAAIKTKIRFLSPGQVYSLTFYVASAGPKWSDPTSYVENCFVMLTDSRPDTWHKNQEFKVSVACQNVWLKKTITFKATSDEMDLILRATSNKKGKNAYAHFFVGNDVIKKLN